MTVPDLLTSAISIIWITLSQASICSAMKMQDASLNTTNLIECMKHDKVRFVSHPDDDRTPLDYDRLVQAARDYHVALEVNNSSLIKKEKRVNCYDNYRTMLDLCQQYRVPITVSSDAHDPSGVGNFTLALELLEEIGFDEDLILTNDIDKLKSFIR